MAPATRELTGNRRTAECTAGLERIQGILNGSFSVIGFAVSTVQASEGLCSGPSSSRSSNHVSVLLGLEYGCTLSGKLTMGVSRENQGTTSFIWGGDDWESRSCSDSGLSAEFNPIWGSARWKVGSGVVRDGMLFLYTRDYIMPVPKPGAGLSLVCAFQNLQTLLFLFNHGYIEEALFGFTGGWLTFWVSVSEHAMVYVEARSLIREDIACLCHRYDFVWI
jgi:hypothetical protein